MEEILENLAALSESCDNITVLALSERSGISADKLVPYLETMRSEGYLDEGENLVPTVKGLAMGKRMVRKHRLLERFLHDVLEMRKERVHDDACKLEHGLSDEAEAALCRYLGHPQNCPDDNRPIPPCNMDVENCEECIAGKVHVHKNPLVPLSALEPGRTARVRFIRGGRNAVHRLRDMGLVTNAKVRVLKRAPFSGPVEIMVCSTRLAIGRNLADKVFVEIC